MRLRPICPQDAVRTVTGVEQVNLPLVSSRKSGYAYVRSWLLYLPYLTLRAITTSQLYGGREAASRQRDVYLELEESKVPGKAVAPAKLPCDPKRIGALKQRAAARAYPTLERRTAE